MDIISKVKWVLGILLVFFLIVATNLVDKNNFTRIRDAAVSIYEDRLVAKNLIFELSILIQEKEIAYISSDSSFFENRNTIINQNVEKIILDYLNTELTYKEEQVFDELQVNLNELMRLESSLQEGSLSDNVFEKQIAVIKENLYELATIQLDEGSRQLSISKEVMEEVNLFTQIEIYFLLALAILIQIIVIYKPKSGE